MSTKLSTDEYGFLDVVLMCIKSVFKNYKFDEGNVRKVFKSNHITKNALLLMTRQSFILLLCECGLHESPKILRRIKHFYNVAEQHRSNLNVAETINYINIIQNGKQNNLDKKEKIIDTFEQINGQLVLILGKKPFVNILKSKCNIKQGQGVKIWRVLTEDYIEDINFKVPQHLLMLKMEELQLLVFGFNRKYNLVNTPSSISRICLQYYQQQQKTMSLPQLVDILTTYKYTRYQCDKENLKQYLESGKINNHNVLQKENEVIQALKTCGCSYDAQRIFRLIKCHLESLNYNQNNVFNVTQQQITNINMAETIIYILENELNHINYKSLIYLDNIKSKIIDTFDYINAQRALIMGKRIFIINILKRKCNIRLGPGSKIWNNLQLYIEDLMDHVFYKDKDLAIPQYLLLRTMEETELLVFGFTREYRCCYIPSSLSRLCIKYYHYKQQ